MKKEKSKKIVYLKDKFPEAYKMLHPTKNEGIDLDKIAACSKKKYWFLMPYDDEETGKHFDFEWEYSTETISANNKLNCPYLTGHKIWVGYNDFETRNPFAMEFWDYEENNSKPTEISYASSQLINFKCELGHKWKQSAHYIHTNKKCICPQCNKTMKISYNEAALYFYIKKIEEDVIWTYKDLGFEIDLYVKSKNIGIEYDGETWHKDKEKDIRKNLLCEENKIKLYRIREQKCEKLNSSSIDIHLKDNSKEEFSKAIHNLIFDIWNIDMDINLQKDNIDILNLYMIANKKNCITDEKLLNNWNYEKNFPLTPNKISYGSNKKVWWKGLCGHEWERNPNEEKISKGCPICQSKILLEGFNDLETKFPEVTKEWDYEKNFPLTPKMVFPKSSKKVWWKCKKGHSYLSSINSKTSGSECNVCNSKVIIESVNDFASNNSLLMKEWNFEKNVGIDPKKLFCNSHKRVWWKCKEGHEWITSIDNRVDKKSGCPTCNSMNRKEDFSNIWNEWYKLLLECLKTEKIENIKCTYTYNDKNLGEWCRAQRKKYKKNKLSEDQVNKLKSVGLIKE